MKRLFPDLLLKFIVLLTPFYGKCQQQFQVKFHEQQNTFGKQIMFTQDGGYLIEGSVESGNHAELFLRKLDANFSISWNHSIYRADSLIRPGKIHEHLNGDFTGLGSQLLDSTQADGNSDLIIYRTNSTGNILWSKKSGNSTSIHPVDLRILADNSFYTCSRIKPFAGNESVLLGRYDANGNSIWNKSLSAGNKSRAASLILTSDDRLVVAGTTSLSGSNSSFFLSKLDSSGNYLWFNAILSGTTDTCNQVLQTNDGGFIMIGSGGSNGQNILLIKTDINGTIQVSKAFRLGFGSNYMESTGQQIRNTADGGYIISGLTRLTGGDPFICAIKLSQNLVVEWYNTYGFIHYSDFGGILQTPDPGYIITGARLSPGEAFYSSLLIKTDSTGHSGCLETGADLTELFENPLSNFISATQNNISLQNYSSGLQVRTPSFVSDTSCYLGTGIINTDKIAANTILYPNPAQDEIHIETGTHLSEPLKFELTTYSGQTAIHVHAKLIGQDHYRIDTRDLAAGMYLLNIYGSDKILIRKKLVLIR